MLLISVTATLIQYRISGTAPLPGDDVTEEREMNEEETPETYDGSFLLAGLQALPFIYQMLRFLLLHKEV